MTITKEHLVEAIAKGAGCSKEAAGRGYDELVKTITGGITEKHGEVQFRGIGSFKTSETEARPGRNPRTGEPIEIPAGVRVKFTAGKALRDALAITA